MPSNYRDEDGKDPFSDEKGNNPFAEDGEELPEPADDGPYAASAEGPYTYKRGDFETVLTNRGRLILGLGIVGTIVSLFGPVTWYLWTASAGLKPWHFGTLSAGVLGLSFAVPAFVFAMKDLRAMDLGAMESSGRRRTIVGAIFGLFGSVVAAVSIGLVGWWMGLP